MTEREVVDLCGAMGGEGDGPCHLKRGHPLPHDDGDAYWVDEADVVALMDSCRTYDDWDAACQRVKELHDGGYPPYWYPSIIASGLHDRVRKRWGDVGPRFRLATFEKDGTIVHLDPNPHGRDN